MTIYRIEDMEGLTKAFLSGRKSNRALGKVFKVIIPILFIHGIISFVTQIVSKNIPLDPIFLFIIAVYLVIGILIFLFYIMRPHFMSKSSWKAYPYKGEQISNCFYDNEFVIKNKHFSTKAAYSVIIRLYEDSVRFYLFTSPQMAYILPKRDFLYDQIVAFRDFISSSTGLQIEHN